MILLSTICSVWSVKTSYLKLYRDFQIFGSFLLYFAFSGIVLAFDIMAILYIACDAPKYEAAGNTKETVLLAFSN